MVEETQEPGGEETGLEEEAPRPAARRPRATQPMEPAARRAEPPRAGGMPSFVGTALAAAVLMIAGGGVFAGGFFTNEAMDDDGGTSAVVNPTAPAGQTPVVQATPTPAILVAASVDDDPYWGPEDAPVTIIDFSDFQ